MSSETVRRVCLLTFFRDIRDVCRRHVGVNLREVFAFHWSSSREVRSPSDEKKIETRKKICCRYHRHGHLVDFMFIFGFMLTEWTVPEISRVHRGNQTERERRTLWVVYRAYIQMRTSRHWSHRQRLWPTLPVPCTRVSRHWHAASSWKNHRRDPDRRCAHVHVHPEGCSPARKWSRHRRFADRSFTDLQISVDNRT